MAVRTPDDLLERQLGVMLGAEGALLDGIATMASRATDPRLQDAFRAHEERARRQMRNLHEAFRRMGKDALSLPCPAAQGLIEDHRRAIAEIPNGASREHARALVDAQTAAAASLAEFYAVAAYRVLVAQAYKLGRAEIADLLMENLALEEATASAVARLHEELTLDGLAVS